MYISAADILIEAALLQEITYATGDQDSSGVQGGPPSDGGGTRGKEPSFSTQRIGSACPRCGSETAPVVGSTRRCLNPSCQRASGASQLAGGHQGSGGVHNQDLSAPGHLRSGGPIQSNEVTVKYVGNGLFELTVEGVSVIHGSLASHESLLHRFWGYGLRRPFAETMMKDLSEWLTMAKEGDTIRYDTISNRRTTFGKDGQVKHIRGFYG
jgi:hypothetical protein